MKHAGATATDGSSAANCSIRVWRKSHPGCRLQLLAAGTGHEGTKGGFQMVQIRLSQGGVHCMGPANLAGFSHKITVHVKDNHTNASKLTIANNQSFGPLAVEYAYRARSRN